MDRALPRMGIMRFIDSCVRGLDPRRFFVLERMPHAATVKRGWLHWIVGVLTVLALYAALGFWAVPAVLPPLLARQADQHGGRQFSAGEIRFNPFTLRLQASGLRLRDRDGSNLLALEGLVAQPQWRSITQRAWSFAEITLSRPAAWVRIGPDGDFNLARLLADFAGDTQRPADAALPRVLIERFAVEQGRVDFDDRHAGYRNVIAPVSFDLQHFSTLPEHGQDHVFSARSQRGGVVRWKGRTSLQPLHASGEFTLENVSLPELAVYLKPWTRATLAAGQLDATVPYTFSYAQGEVQARVTGARTRLHQLAVAQQGARDPFAALDGLELTASMRTWYGSASRWRSSRPRAAN